jgi:hypothetical protein
MAVLVPILRVAKGLSTIIQSGGSPVFAGETASRPIFHGFNEVYANRLNIPLALQSSSRLKKCALVTIASPKE